MKTRKPGPATLALHAGHDPEEEVLSRAVPIFQTTSFLFKDTEHAAGLFALEREGHIYTRISNPTTSVLEKRLAALHAAPAALCAASGMAAVFHAVAALAEAGRNIVSGSNLYGGTRAMFEHTLSRFGIEARFVDSSNPANFLEAADENTRLFYTESIGNPRCNIDDIPGIAEAARKAGVPFVLDNTVAPPPMFDPFSAGADIAVYSLTKIIGGHGTSIGGAVVEKGGFDWAASGNYPEIADAAQKASADTAFTTALRNGLHRDLGASLSPFNAFLLLQGLETLPLRAKAHCANAQAVAEFLEAHPAVAWVGYAGLPGHKDHARAERLFPMGPGAVFGFGVEGGIKAGRKFIESVKLCSHLANILDAKTLVIHPATTTHAQLGPEERRQGGVPDDMIRISVGIEEIEDILEDLNQALNALRP